MCIVFTKRNSLRFVFFFLCLSVSASNVHPFGNPFFFAIYVYLFHLESQITKNLKWAKCGWGTEIETKNAFAHRTIVCYIEHTTVVYFHLLCIHKNCMNSTKRLIAGKSEKNVANSTKKAEEKKQTRKEFECVQGKTMEFYPMRENQANIHHTCSHTALGPLQ